MSSYSKPDVIVKRVITPSAVVLETTAQKLCIIGTTAQIEKDKDAGTYTGGDELFPFPDIKNDAIVTESSIKVNLVKDGTTYPMDLGTDFTAAANNAGITVLSNRIEYNDINGSQSSNGAILNGVLTDPQALFVDFGVGIGDKVYSDQLVGGMANIETVNSNTSLKIERPLKLNTGHITTDGTVNIVLDSATLGDFDDLSAGDELIISGTGDANVDGHGYIVASVTDSSHLALTTAITYVGSAGVAMGYSNENDTLSLTYSILKRVVLGEGGGSKVLMSYVAPRNVTEVTLVDDLSIFTEKYGKNLNPDNPISMAANIAYKNGAVKFYSVVIPSNSYADHMAAITLIDSLDVTYIVPLTMDKSILDAYEAHVVNASLPENKRERIALGATDIAFRNVKIDSDVSTVVDLGNDQYEINVPGSDMAGSGINNGDLVYLEKVEIGDIQPTTRYSVVSIASSTSVIVESSTDISGHVGAVSIASPEYTKRQIAEYVKNISIGILKENVLRIWPPKAEVDTEDGLSIQDGFYLCVAMGSLAASNYAHKPLTNSTLSGFGDLNYSNGYFTEADLDEMASGGVSIMVQDGIGSAPKIRHQLTTNMTEVKTREFSFIKNLYYLTKAYREAMSGYTGKYNINKTLFDLMTLSAQAIFKEWYDIHGDLGARVIKVELVSIGIDPNEEDKIISTIKATLPLPNNKTVITFYA